MIHTDIEFDSREDFITSDSVDSLVLERSPDFLDYLFFRNVSVSPIHPDGFGSGLPVECS